MQERAKTLVNISLCMCEVISTFGPFVKLIIAPKNNGQNEASSSAVPPLKIPLKYNCWHTNEA